MKSFALVPLVASVAMLCSCDAFAQSSGTAPAVATASSPTLEEAQRANQLAQAAFYSRQAQEATAGGDRTPWWEPLLLGAGLTVAGSIASLLMTDRNAARKTRDDEERLYGRQKLQVGLTVRALIEALARIDLTGERPVADFLSRKHLLTQPTLPARFARKADYYLKYDLVSTIYRLCALLGWMELYRTDPQFVSGLPSERASFESAFSSIRTILSDDDEAGTLHESGPSTAPREWMNDGVILADDQRAIGERMLAVADDKLTRVVGYAFFAETLFRFPGYWKSQQDPGEGEHPELPQDHWVWNATSFFVGINDADGPDFRVVRLRMLSAVLRDLLSKLVPVELQNGLTMARTPWYLRDP